MPFETMAIDTAGNVMPCCAYDPKYALFDYTTTPITIDEYFTSDKLQEIKDSFLDGKIPNGCINCIQKEKYGMKSKRQKWSHNRQQT